MSSSKRDAEGAAEGHAAKKARAAPRVLLLGSGLCSPPLVRYLADAGLGLTVASRTLERAQRNVEGLATATAAQLDVEADGAEDRLDALVREHDVVVSLLPYVHHPMAARVALRHKRHFCTASYVSDALEALDGDAREAGVTLVNECGVDPGLDIASSQKVIDEVHAAGGKVLEFFSICGGLPAPQDNNNPFGYKLSWSPRGVLLAAGNSATILERGEVRSAAGPVLYSAAEVRHDTIDGQRYEYYYNRDSVKFRELQRVPEVRTIVRGTYRYPGWCRMMQLFAEHGVVADKPVDGLGGLPVREGALRSVGLGGDPAAWASAGAARAAVAGLLGVGEDHDTVARLEWVGYFDGELRLPEGTRSALDVMGFLFDRSLQYAPKERDMIVMRHTFEVERASGMRETVTSTLIDFGLQDAGGESSMSRTVGLPLAVATHAVAEGRLSGRGILRPTDPEMYNLLLGAMEKYGVRFAEAALGPLVWVRAETKPGEQRAALSPESCKAMIAAGYRVVCERSEQRGIADAEYELAGCEMADAGSWARAPLSAVICGLKELPESHDPLPHRHVFFAHAYKGQVGWRDVLGRFVRGGGELWDLEYLVDDNGRRVAAFGRAAGEVGMALGLKAWSARVLGRDLNDAGRAEAWPSHDAMVADVKEAVRAAREHIAREEGEEAARSRPDTLVVGALGRSGRGACDVAVAAGIEPVRWDMAETSKGGPFPRMVEADVLVNCILLQEKIAPFVTEEMVRAPGRRLSTFVDVSADTTNPNSPTPFYHQETTLFKPVLHLDCGKDAAPLDIVAIDHLPTLLPNESTRQFSGDIVKYFIDGFRDPKGYPFIRRAADLFEEKTRSIR